MIAVKSESNEARDEIPEEATAVEKGVSETSWKETSPIGATLEDHDSFLDSLTIEQREELSVRLADRLTRMWHSRFQDAIMACEELSDAHPMLNRIVRDLVQAIEIMDDEAAKCRKEVSRLSNRFQVHA